MSTSKGRLRIPLQSCGQAIVIGVREQEKSASTSTKQFSAGRTGGPGAFVDIVYFWVGHRIRQRSLLRPRLVEQWTDSIDVSSLQSTS